MKVVWDWTKVFWFDFHAGIRRIRTARMYLDSVQHSWASWMRSVGALERGFPEFWDEGVLLLTASPTFLLLSTTRMVL